MIRRINPILILALIIAVLVLLTGASSTSRYIGSSRCRDCHQKEYEKWRDSEHAKSAASISEKERKQVRCQVCHETADGRFQEVGCEACHGGGRYYSYENVMRDRELSRLLGLEAADANTCRRCHTKEGARLQAFDEKKAMESIRHWGDDEERK